MAEIARSIELYNSAFRLAWSHISERQKREQSDMAQRLHDSITRLIKEGASLDVLIASEALDELTGRGSKESASNALMSAIGPKQT
jgi:hypothetical protein